MADAWDEGSDDDWENAGDDIDLGGAAQPPAPPSFEDEEEDLAVKEKAEAERMASVQLKKKGNALQMKKDAEENRRIEEEAARKAMELEADMEANMTIDERKALERKRIEDADNALTEDLFGGMSDGGKKSAGAADNSAALVFKDLKDVLKHAKKVGAALRKAESNHLALTFFKEVISEGKGSIDEDSVGEIIKALNVLALTCFGKC
ncbi:hypothetical protein TrRE_jg8458 [Triparma retinervis]|uniref:Uncharacterized protein n=1 Tax=Triparma retinervis TaxID=2557542 RepID=A0A9W7DML5_9STRA|nr:hypothetical protein TrRE_jg8458 [Triparma retinervis]